MLLGGLDIGGTKCAAVAGRVDGENIRVLSRVAFSTPRNPADALPALLNALEQAAAQAGCSSADFSGIGISCGGPLDSSKGLILSPPNLIGWDEVPAAAYFEERTGVKTRLINDANACALAEWRFGAGRGARSMIFLTFGTGMGAGLILDGRLYAGASDMAGECGHMRLSSIGPVGYGKAGSFEGFCSGGGLSQLGRMKALEALQSGSPASFCPTLSDLDGITARSIAQAADAGDVCAKDVYTLCGEYLGRGLSILIDLLNPEAIVIGSIYARSENLLRDAALRIIEQETLSYTRNVCRILPAGLGEAIGDIAALSAAME